MFAYTVRRVSPFHSGAVCSLRPSLVGQVLVMTQELFPLRLADFEDYAFRDDSPEHPMVIVLRVVVEGSLNREAFRGSLEQTLSENPLLQSVIRPSWRGNYWHPIESAKLPLSVESYSDDTLPLACPQKSFDLTKEAGVWFDLRVSPGRSVLIAHFHHACCDGIGSIRFIGDVFAHYGNLTASADQEPPEIRRIDPETLKLRGTRRMPRHGADRKAPLLHTICEATKLFCLRSYRFLSKPVSRQEPVDETVRNVIHTRVLSRSVLKHLKKFAAERGVSTNDLCMTVFLQLLSSWSRQDSANGRDLLRILMPVSMRNPSHDPIPAANIVSYCFHSYQRRETADFDSLLRKVNQKSQQMINRNEGAAMLYGFAATRCVPGLMRLAQKVQPDYATAVMTNVGEVRRLFENRFPLKAGRAVAGDVVIHRIDGVAPVRQNTNITMSCGTYGGELIVHISRNTQIFSESDALFFVNSLADRLTQLADTHAAEKQSKGGSEVVAAGTTVDVRN